MNTLALTTESVRRFLVLCCLVCGLVLVGGCFTGCATQNAPGRILATAVQSVDSAMQGWASYVALGRATDAQQASVRALYEKYQAAESAAETAYVAAAKLGDATIFERASVSLRAAQNDLLQLIEEISRPKTPSS